MANEKLKNFFDLLILTLAGMFSAYSAGVILEKFGLSTQTFLFALLLIILFVPIFGLLVLILSTIFGRIRHFLKLEKDFLDIAVEKAKAIFVKKM